MATDDGDWIEFWQNVESDEYVRVELVEESKYYLDDLNNNILTIDKDAISTQIDFKNEITIIFSLPKMSLDDICKFPVCSSMMFSNYNMNMESMQLIYAHFILKAVNASFDIRLWDGLYQRSFQRRDDGIYSFRMIDYDTGIIRRILELDIKISLCLRVTGLHMNVDMRPILFNNALRFNDIIFSGGTREQIQLEFKQEQERQRTIELRIALRTCPLPQLPRELIFKLEKLYNKNT